MSITTVPGKREQGEIRNTHSTLTSKNKMIVIYSQCKKQTLYKMHKSWTWQFKITDIKIL